MSRETLQTLNISTLIGCTTERGRAWHYRANAQGAESNHYDGFIPAADVDRRLFDFTAEEAPLFVQIPAASLQEATGMHEDGTPYRMAPAGIRKALIHSATGAVLGVHGMGYRAHQFPTLTTLVADILDTGAGDLGISSAGVLRGGALGWIEVSVPRAIHLQREGVVFRPNLLATTSHNGTLSTTLKRTITNVVCDNTHAAAMAETSATFRIRHTSGSALRLADARAALDVLEVQAEVFTEHVQTLVARPVDAATFERFMTLAVPMPDKPGRSRTLATTKGEQMRQLWRHDHRVAPWSGTAWGMVQMVNTHAHHVASARGAQRAERNTLRAIDGTAEALDAQTLDLLAQASA